jgi:hypothetical protein
MFDSFLSIANCLIYAIGVIATLKVVSIVYAGFKATATVLNAKWAAKYGSGSWAVVTGCT